MSRLFSYLFVALLLWSTFAFGKSKRPLCSDAFFEAALNRDIGKMNMHLKENCDLNEENSSHTTLLINAVMGPHSSKHKLRDSENGGFTEGSAEDAVSLLIKKGADVNRSVKLGSPLIFALNPHILQKEIVDLLIRAGASVEVQDFKGASPLHLAAQAGNVELIDLFIRKGVSISAQDSDGKTPLHYVTNKTAAERLLKMGANVTARDNRDVTPLHDVANVDIARLFIEKGVDVNTRDGLGRTPILSLNVCGADECYLIAQVLVQRGADINAVDSVGQTALHRALRSNSRRLVEALVSLGARVDLKDNRGKTALSIASEQQSMKDLLEILQHNIARK